MRKLCPKCKGGRSRELSMSLVGEAGKVQAWLCWRNKCGHRELATGVQVAPEVRRLELPPLVALPTVVAVQIADKAHLTAQYLKLRGVMYAPTWHRVAYPLLSRRGALRGYVLRSYEAKPVGPKALLVPCDGGSTLCGWYAPWQLPDGEESPSCVVAVEDCLSALRLAWHGIQAVALSGTHLRADVVAEMAAASRTIIVALDADASARAIVYTMRSAGIKCLPLLRDIKDQSESELNGTIERIRKLACRSTGKP